MNTSIEEIKNMYSLKKDELEKLILSKEVERKTINLRIDRLKENKDKEIEEYLKSNFVTRPVGRNEDYYLNMVKKDLETAYSSKEKQLQENLEKQIVKINLDILQNKKALKEQLLRDRNDIELELNSEKEKFNNIMSNLSSFKYEYNEQGQVINGGDWRSIYESSNQVSSRIYELQDCLKMLEEYLIISELTEEELKLMIDKTLLEKEGKTKEEIIENLSKKQTDKEEIEVIEPQQPEEVETPVLDEKPKGIIVYPEGHKDISNVTLIKEDTKKEEIDSLDSLKELSKIIYMDIMEEIENMNSINVSKLSEEAYTLKSKSADHYQEVKTTLVSKEVELAPGLFINSKDLDKAILNYYKKNKGKRYVVKEIDQTVTISAISVMKFKKSLKECCAIRLLGDKKIGDFDVKRVFGKEKYESLKNFTSMGEVEVAVPNGTYLSRDQVMYRLKNLFTTKENNWINRIREKLNEKNLFESTEIKEETEKTLIK